MNPDEIFLQYSLRLTMPMAGGTLYAFVPKMRRGVSTKSTGAHLRPSACIGGPAIADFGLNM